MNCCTVVLPLHFTACSKGVYLIAMLGGRCAEGKKKDRVLFGYRGWHFGEGLRIVCTSHVGREASPFCEELVLTSDLMWWLTTGIFTVTYAGLAVGKYPKLRVDRAGIAFVGAAAMLCAGVISLEQATGRDSIDYETLFLLFGMMVVVGFLRMSGFFVRVTEWCLERIHSPRRVAGDGDSAGGGAVGVSGE